MTDSLEPDAMKVARPVLRGRGAVMLSLLPDRCGTSRGVSYRFVPVDGDYECGARSSRALP